MSPGPCTLSRPLLRDRGDGRPLSKGDGRAAIRRASNGYLWVHVLAAAIALACSLRVQFRSGDFVCDVPTMECFTDAGEGFMTAKQWKLAKQIIMPVGSLALGCILHQSEAEGAQIVSKLLVYLGAQTGMHLYMKAVLSNAVVSQELGLKGIPAAFLVTALQQVTAFLIMGVILLVTWPTRFRYVPKQLKTIREWLAVVCFSLSFALNIGMNNFSLSLLSISMNLIVRSCMPLSTAVSQMGLGMLTGAKGGGVTAKEMAVMLVGVLFAGLATLAKSNSAGDDSEHLILGCAVGVLSIFSGAINFVLAGWLGTSVKLNPLDTTCYMSIPATFFLLVPILLMPHPVSWPGYASMTDWQVFLEVMRLSPSTIGLAILSGLFAVSYNVLQYALVQSLSATYTAFAGNFNKAATVVLSLLLGLESLPDGFWGAVMVFAITGNIGAFTAYSMMKTSKK